VLIDCDTCEVRGPACGDCVVTVLLGPLPGLELDPAEEAAIDVLASSGLVPPLRLVAPDFPRRVRPQNDSAVSRRASGA
jgi:hypothetical protein